MKLWMLPWLFPVGLLATVVLVSAFPGNEGLLLLAGGLLLAVLIGSIVFPPRRDDGRDPDTDYWRLRDWTDRRG
jgi:hypothetical protein